MNYSRFSRLCVISTGFLALTGCLTHETTSTNRIGCNPAARSQPSLSSLFLESQNKAGYLLDSQDRKMGHRKLFGHVPAGVRTAMDQGLYPRDSEVSFSVTLGSSTEEKLDQFLIDLFQPGSPTFLKFLTSEEFIERFAPSAAQVDEVVKFLTSNGFRVNSVSQNRFLVQVQGKVDQINSTFRTQMHRYRSREGQDKFAPAYELQVPEQIPIQAVHGLENFSHHFAHVKPRQELQEIVQPHFSGTGPLGGFSPGDIRSGYQIPAGVQGREQTLALFELDHYSQTDIETYEKYFGITPVPLRNIFLDGAGGSLGAGAGEVTLDIELMTAIAPGVKEILVYEGQNTIQGVLNVYNKIATDNLAQSVSTSWGMSEDQAPSSFLQAENTIFKQMAAQGQSIFAAAGDEGAYDNGSSLSVDDPASQPFMTGVGGTTLSLDGKGSYLKESTWGSLNSKGSIGSPGGGGGVSKIWPIPSWQKSVSGSQTLASNVYRNVPDVSLNSDPNTGYAIYFQGSWTVFGGTSCAAPLWAGFNSLVNEQRAAFGLGPVGFVNPTLYQLGNNRATYTTGFHDIQDKSTNLYYLATVGYDNATGWGSFVGELLIPLLGQLDLGLPPTMQPSSPTTPNPISLGSCS